MNRIGCLILLSALFSPLANAAKIVTFPSGEITLHGALYKPVGKGPFPAVVYNHGSAPGMMSSSAFEALGPVFARHGWVFFGPYRRGQGLGASRVLAAAMKEAGKPYKVKIYPAYGKSTMDGHTFGYFGASVWANDVFRFLNSHCS